MTLEGGFDNCAITVKQLNNARKHVRKHLAVQPPIEVAATDYLESGRTCETLILL